MFKNKNTLITGATGRLGSEISIMFSKLGSNLILIDNDKKKLNSLKKKIKNDKIDIHIFQCDFLKKNSRISLLKSIKKKNYTIDFVINNAAYTGLKKNNKSWTGDFYEQNVDLWNEAIEVNLTSIFHLTKELFKNQKKNNKFSVINIGSIYSERGPDLSLYEDTKIGSPAAYLASKGGLVLLTKWFASYLAPTRVNMISPGGIYSGQSKKFVNRYLKKLLIKRMCKTKDVVDLLIFLCSDNSKYITGQNIKIDGGYTSI
mgnify:CR=1 FL=1|jgi:NAD(P)-dependent dehydrogenase (short-subunit alcohol dehydrogenase family)